LNIVLKSVIIRAVYTRRDTIVSLLREALCLIFVIEFEIVCGHQGLQSFDIVLS